MKPDKSLTVSSNKWRDVASVNKAPRDKYKACINTASNTPTPATNEIIEFNGMAISLPVREIRLRLVALTASMSGETKGKIVSKMKQS